MCYLGWLALADKISNIPKNTFIYIYILFIYCIHVVIVIIYVHIYIAEGSLEVKLPTTWTDEKQRWSRRIEKRRAEERRSETRKSQKKEDAGSRKGRKVAKHCVFPMICGSRGSKSRLAKAAGAEPAGQMRDEKLHAVVARSTFPKSKCTKHTRSGPLLEVEMSKKCTPFWHEAHCKWKS